MDARELDRVAARIRIVLMDVDGVLTDGTLWYLPDGQEMKAFHVRDGAGIRLAQEAGLMTGIISGRPSDVASRRATELDLDEIHLDVADKNLVLDDILARRGLQPEEVCFIGDDIVDLRVLRRVGLAAAPADAHPMVKIAAGFLCEADGGRGAVREVIDRILSARKPQPQKPPPPEEKTPCAPSSRS